MNEERLKFAQRFADLASQLGYEGHGRQTRLAAYYGKKQPSVKKWFDGDAQPDYEICVDICRRAKAHYEWLMTGRGPKSIDSPAQDQSVPQLSLVYVDQDELAIITAYREANEVGKGSIKIAAETAPRSDSLGAVPSSN